tara:strand:+ start:321 stop:449 length:129 start_codon:yes stop_codon:yes gene_type:complete
MPTLVGCPFGGAKEMRSGLGNVNGKYTEARQVAILVIKELAL